MDYFLLTGATGLLGRYLLRDLALADLPLAVVVRPSRFESAAQRIETAMAYWEESLGHALPRPVVLEGDISQPLLGLSAADLAWTRANCRAVIHSAASLTFHAEEKTGEPYRSNVEGTRNVLALSREAGIRHMHYVSTAYVCGLRRGRILESDLDVGQQLGNDYERTKIAAEKEVLASPDFDCVTVYRPSIIVGDSQTGFTTSYHGFYTPLRLVYSLLQSVPWETILQSDWLGKLQLRGEEHKNLVSVEWVSAAMAALIPRPECHGTTYHLTNPRPATTLLMREAMSKVLAEVATSKESPRASAVSDDFLESFRQQMGIYEAYWSDDPGFDSTNTQATLPELPCPEIDALVMERLVRFAISSNFGWPREAARVPSYEAAPLLRPWLEVPESSSPRERTRQISLQVNGPGGGQWHLAVDDRRLIRAGVGLASGAAATCFLTSDTLAELTQGQLALEDSINTGRLVVAGNAVHPHELDRYFSALGAGEPTRTFQKA